MSATIIFLHVHKRRSFLLIFSKKLSGLPVFVYEGNGNWFDGDANQEEFVKRLH